MLRPILTALLLLAPLGCGQPDDLAPTEYVDGERKLTDDGGFLVELSHVDGAPVLGSNEFVLRVMMPNHEESEFTDIGIPNAQISVDCWMPNVDHDMPVNPMVVPGAMGDYRLAHIEFDEAGVWQLDFEIGVGDTVVESVSFAFLVE